MLIVLIFSWLFITLFVQINNLKKNYTWEESSNLIALTPTEKKSSLAALQSDLKANIYSLQDSIAAIYAKKTIWSIVENEIWEEKNIETVKSLEWNAIVVNNEWYLITNKHVVSSTTKASYTAVLQGMEYNVDKIWMDDLLDIAILKIKTKENTKPATIVKLDWQANIWDIVFAIKNDTDIWEFITNLWFINSKNQKLEIQNNNDIYVWLLKNSSNIEAGFSWWPLININWEVVWINTAVDNIEYGASYALPISQEFVNQTLASIKESSRIIRPYLWIEYEEYNWYAKVTNILENTTAAKTNIEIWDIIVWIDNNPVTYNNFLYNLYTYKVWKEITLNINKDWHKKDVQITIWKKQ